MLRFDQWCPVPQVESWQIRVATKEDALYNAENSNVSLDALDETNSTIYDSLQLTIA